MTTHDNCWSFIPPLAELQTDALSGRVDVSRPQLGLHQLQFSGHNLAGGLLSIRRGDSETPRAAPTVNDWPLAVADAYVRGYDLVASYLPSDDWPYSPQIYWQADAPGEPRGVVSSLALLISVQTHLLDTWPRINVSSQMACDELLHVSSTAAANGTSILSPDRKHTLRPAGAPCCIVWRLADVPLSYAEIVPASDFREVRLWHDVAHGWHAEWHLLADFLEKGVIRRARLQSVFLPRENDVQVARACCETFERRPLPLTT